MTKVIKGQCNHCGKCCKPPVIIDNSCISREEDKCKFYTEILNTEKYGHCLILAALNSGISMEEIKDRFGKKITKEQIRWFKDNCIDYPKLGDMVKGYMPPEGCGFYLEEI